MQALTYLQRALLVHDLQALDALEWESCFNKVHCLHASAEEGWGAEGGPYLCTRQWVPSRLIEVSLCYLTKCREDHWLFM